MRDDVPATPTIDSRPPQFRLRTLLLFVTLCSAAFATMTAVGPVWSVVLSLFAALAAAHVAGNAIGTRLRDEASRRASVALRPPASDISGKLPPRPKMMPLRLREHRPLGQGLIVATVCGAAAGAVVGWQLFLHGPWRSVNAADGVLGMVSCAVLGGLAGFLASSFFEVALWPAVAFFFQRGSGPSTPSGRDRSDAHCTEAANDTPPKTPGSPAPRKEIVAPRNDRG